MSEAIEIAVCVGVGCLVLGFTLGLMVRGWIDRA
jgi:hypothetical protein